MFTIHRNIRAAFDDTIKKRNEELIRNRFPGRIIDGWEGFEEIGLLGIEGSSSDDVKRETRYLENSLQPVIIDGHPEMYFGIGEACVRDCAKRYGVLVDIDKFINEIYVFGSDALIAVREIEKYKHVKLEVTVNISTFAPFFNCLNVLDRGIVMGLEADCQMREDVIQFIGSLEAYEKLTEALVKISDVYIKNFKSSNPARNICKWT